MTIDAAGGIGSTADGTIATTPAADGDDGGNVTLDAGTGVDLLGGVDTSGAANPAGDGGSGGEVMIATLDGPISIVDATTSGAPGDATPANDGLSGAIALTAGDADASGGSDLSLAGVLSSPGGRITLTAAGNILDANDLPGPTAVANLTAAELLVPAAAGFGTGDAIESEMAVLEAAVGNGGLLLANTGSLTIGGMTSVLIGLTAGGGDVVVFNQGALTIAENVAAASGGIELVAGETGASGDDLKIADGGIVAAGAGDVVLRAGDGVVIPQGAEVTASAAVELHVGVDDVDGVGAGEIGGKIGSGGTRLEVYGGSGDDRLTLNLDTAEFETATWPDGVLRFDAGDGQDTLAIVATDGRDVFCIDDGESAVRWQGPGGPMRFDYEDVEVLDIASGGGDDEVSFAVAAGKLTTVRLDAGDEAGLTAIGDGLRIAGTDAADKVLVLDFVTSADAALAALADQHPEFESQRNAAAEYQIFRVADVEAVQAWGRGGDDWLVNFTDVTSLLAGGDGDDVLAGGQAADAIFGGDGRDELFGHGGDDYLLADHRFAYPRPEWVDPTTPDEVVEGGAGRDTIVAVGDFVNGGGSATENDLYVESGHLTVIDWLMARFRSLSDVDSVIDAVIGLRATQAFADCAALFGGG